MQSFTRNAVATAALIVGALAPELARAQALPAASEIVAKYVTAIGGKAEVMKITSFKQTATMSVPSVGLNAEMEMYAAAPNKTAMKATIPGLGDMVQGYNGAVGWDVNPMAGPRLLADKELATTAENAEFYSNMLYSADRYASMETVGDSTINGEKVYKVKMVRKATMKESMTYFSASSGLLLASFSTTESQGGQIPVLATMAEYKKFGGVLMPTKLEQVSGANRIVVTIKDVTLNDVPASAFDVPANVQPLIKK